MIHDYYNSDQNLGNDIQQKMENLLSTTNDINLDTDKLNLKPEDLTLANVDENNYSFADVQNSLDINDTSFHTGLTEGLPDNTNDLFASVNLELEDDIDIDLDRDLENNKNKNKTTEENINDLVF